jgi:predicted DCC family thiol-disulfide oxidoreductase YuxK
MPARPIARTGGQSILFFDGECVLCNGFADFVKAHDRKARFRLASLQGETARAMGAAEALSHGPSRAEGGSGRFETVLLWEGGRWYRRSDAALRAMAGLDGAWALSRSLLLIPRFLRDAVYVVIARNRYRWFGKREACRVPAPWEGDRFLP